MRTDKRTFLFLLALTCCGILFYRVLEDPGNALGLVSHMVGLFFPFLLGFCIAFVLNVPMRFFEDRFFPNAKHPALRAVRRPLGIVVSLCFILAVLAVVFALVVPEFINAIQVLVSGIPGFFADLQEFALQHTDVMPALDKWVASLSVDWNKTAETLLQYLKESGSVLVGNTVSLVSGVVGGVTNGVVAFIFALYILLGKEKLKRNFASLARAVLPGAFCERMFFVLRLSARTFANFVSGQCIEACILGTLTWLGMLLFRFPYAPMIGALVGISALIPIVGAIVGTVVGAFMILMVDPIQAVWFVVFLLTLQQIEGNLIYPRVVGSSVGLPPIWVLTAVTLGGSLWGIVGMLFAVPTCSVVYALTRMFVRERLAERHVPETPDAPRA